MENSRPESNRQEETAEAQLRKLKLEISSLEWQNSKVGRLAQFATIFTILATLVTILATLSGVWQGYAKFITDREKERELRSKELTERFDNQYRSNIQQLFRYPTEENQTIASATFILDDLSNVVENGFQGKELEKRRSEVGTLLTRVIKSPQFDLNKLHHIEFDRIALRDCKYYQESLIKNPQDNMVILTAYKFNLGSLHAENTDFKEVYMEPNSDYSVNW